MNIVDNYYDQAQKDFVKINKKLPLTSAVLDNWGGAIRIVYGAAFVKDCGSKCEECPIYRAVGGDAPDLKPGSYMGEHCIG